MNMNGTVTLVSILLLCMAIVSCNTESTEESSAQADSIAIANPSQNELNSNQSALFREIFRETNNATFRGISFGDLISTVKATETYEMFEELPDHLGYTHETERFETIDIQYFLTTDGKVNKIQVDVYLNSPEATKELWNSGNNYFTNKYGPQKSNAPSQSWEKENIKVQMVDVSQGKDFGLKFVFNPVNKNVMARSN